MAKVNECCSFIIQRKLEEKYPYFDPLFDKLKIVELAKRSSSLKSFLDQLPDWSDKMICHARNACEVALCFDVLSSIQEDFEHQLLKKRPKSRKPIAHRAA